MEINNLLIGNIVNKKEIHASLNSLVRGFQYKDEEGYKRLSEKRAGRLTLIRCTLH